MAELPKYQRAGVQAAQPGSIDFANYREGAKLGQTISQTVDRMSDFLYREQIRKDEQQAGEIVEQMGAKPVLSKLRQAGGPSTYGERKAYEIANRIASSEVETDAMLEINRIITDGENSETPFTEIQSRLGDVVNGFPAALSDLDPEVAGVLRGRLASHATNAELRYSSYWNKKTQQDAQGRALIAISERQQNIYRTAGTDLDPDLRNSLIGEEINNLAQFMRDRNFGEDAISKIMINTKEQATIDGLISDFQRLGSLKEKEAFLDQLTKTPSTELGVEKTRTLVRSLNAEITNSRSISKGAARDVVSDIADLTKILEGGGDPGETQMNAVAVRLLELPPEFAGKATEKFNQLVTVRNAMVGFRKMDPVQLNNEINTLRAGMEGVGGKGVDTLTEVAVLKSAESLLANMNTELEKDPLSWGMRALGADFKPLLLSTLPGGENLQEEQIASSVLARKQLASLVQSVYKGPLKFLTNEEASVFSTALQEGNRGQRLNMLAEIVRHFGSNAKDVLEQIGEKKPELAHVGGLFALGKREEANTALAGLDLIKEGNKAIGTTTDIAKGAYISLVGQGLQFQSQARSAGFKIAEAIYTKMAFDKGIAEFDEAIWQESIQAAFGHDPYRKRGGFQEIRDRKVLLPSQLNSDEMEDMLDKITLEQLQDNTGLDDIDADIISDINNNNRVFPVLLDEGRYFLMFNVNGTPRHFTDNKGNPIILDALKYYNLRRGEDYETMDLIEPPVQQISIVEPEKTKTRSIFEEASP